MLILAQLRGWGGGKRKKEANCEGKSMMNSTLGWRRWKNGFSSSRARFTNNENSVVSDRVEEDKKNARAET